MTEIHEKWVCESCGRVKELDSGWAEAKEVAPEINLGSILPPPPIVAAVAVADTKSSEYIDVGLEFALGDCDECGGHSWQRISLGILEKGDPVAVKPTEPVDFPRDRGFQEAVPPSPESSTGTVVISDVYSLPEQPQEQPQQEPRAPLIPGVSGSLATLPLGEGDTNFSLLFPPEVAFPEAQPSVSGQTAKERYVCEACGEQIELELGQIELPLCKSCGSGGWLKESF